MRIDIVIPNLNGEEHLPVLLQSLGRQSFMDTRIIFVDNGSTDGSIGTFGRLCEELGLGNTVIPLRQNTGFSHAVNVGIKASDTEYVVLLNNDIEADEHLIENLFRAIRERKDAFSASAKMVNFWNRDIIDDAGDGYTILGWGYKAGEGRDVSAYTKDREIFSSCAGAAIYRRKVFDEIGFFDEAFFAYLEDMDISYRARIHGYRNYFASQAVAYHKASATTGGKRSAFKTRLVPRNNIYLLYKNMPLPQLGLNLLPIAAGILVKGVVFSLKGYPREYFASLLEGVTTLSRVKKVRFQRKHLKNYAHIEKDLIMGVWHMLKN